MQLLQLFMYCLHKKQYAHTGGLALGRLRHKHPTHTVLSVHSFHSTECVSTRTLDDCLSPLTLALSCVNVVSLCAEPTRLFISRRSYDPLDSWSWEQSMLGGTWLRGRHCSALWLAPWVLCVQYADVQFLGSQTQRQLVLVNGIYGKTFKWYNQLIKNTAWHHGKGVVPS